MADVVDVLMCNSEEAEQVEVGGRAVTVKERLPPQRTRQRPGEFHGQLEGVDERCGQPGARSRRSTGRTNRDAGLHPAALALGYLPSRLARLSVAPRFSETLGSGRVGLGGGGAFCCDSGFSLATGYIS